MANTTPDAWAKVPLWWWSAIAQEPRHRFNAIGVALVLSRRGDNVTNQCFPSQETIGAELGLSRKRVGEAIDALARVGIVSATKRARKPTVYTVHVVPSTDTPYDATATDAPLTDDVTAAGQHDVTAPGLNDVTADCSVSHPVTHPTNSNDVAGADLNETKMDEVLEDVAAALGRNGFDAASARSEARSVIRAVGSQGASNFTAWLAHLRGQPGVMNPVALAISKTRDGVRPPRSGPRYQDLDAAEAVRDFARARAEQYARDHGISPSAREKTAQYLRDRGMAV